MTTGNVKVLVAVEGFLDVEIRQDEVSFGYPKPTRMVITVPIREGRQYLVDSITIEGNEVFSTAQILQVMALKVGDIMKFTPALNRDQKVKVWIALPIVFRST